MATQMEVDLFACPVCGKRVSGRLSVTVELDAPPSEGVVPATVKPAGLRVFHDCGPKAGLRVSHDCGPKAVRHVG